MELYGVTSTRIYCRAGCASRKPKPANVRPFTSCEEAEAAGFRACKRCQPREALPFAAGSVARVCRYLDDHIDDPVNLKHLASLAGMSVFHFARVFKQTTGMTPGAYARLSRLDGLKRRLREGQTVTRAMVEAGYGSPSRLYEASNGTLGMTPGEYREGGAGTVMRYGIVDSPLGRMLVAATSKGVTMIEFGDSDGVLTAELQREYPNAEVIADADAVAEWTRRLNLHLEGRDPAIELPLDVRASAFKKRVWDELRRIPYGETRTYAELAAAAGNADAIRAAASACATNPVAVAVPCHRVVRTGGGLGGYRWGLSRKVALLERERASKE